jgi:tRNA(fMet)-specific endonuclease VapC
MRCLLDTDTCVAVIRHRPTGVLARLYGEEPGAVGLSAITVAELEFGVRRSRDPQANARALQAFLAPLAIAAFDAAAAAAHGRVRATLEAAGQGIGSMDTLIAAHALALGAVLVTHKTREFGCIPDLLIEDWLG